MNPEVRAEPASRAATAWPADSTAVRPAAPSITTRVGEAVAYMHAHIADENLNLERIAAICRLCRFQTTRAFQRVTGVTPIKFLYALRILRAKQLLAESRMSITEICFEVGYTGLGTFISRFNYSVGQSPSVYRRYVQGNPTFVMTLLECLEEMRCAKRPGLAGSVQTPSAFSGIVFLGAFHSSVPEAVPVACALADDDGRFVLPGAAVEGTSLFALGVPWENLERALMSPEKLPRAALRRMPSAATGSEPRLVLGKPDFLQPPILLCLPALVERMRSRIDGRERAARPPTEVMAPWSRSLSCARP